MRDGREAEEVEGERTVQRVGLRKQEKYGQELPLRTALSSTVHRRLKPPFFY